MDGGFAAIDRNIASRVSEKDYQQSRQLSHKLIRSLLYALYIDTQDRAVGTGRGENSLLFFEDAIPALSRMAEISMPFYIQLEDMQFKPAVRIMVSQRPGEMLFMIGWLLLLAGLLLVFYNWYRRIWLLFEESGHETQVSMAGMGGRRVGLFNREFNALFTRLQKDMQGP